MTKIHALSSLIAGAACAALIVGGASAQDGGHRNGNGSGKGKNGRAPVMMVLQAADANGDNAVTRDEVDAFQTNMFNWRDRNGDGLITIDDRSPLAQFAMEKRQDRAAARADERAENQGEQPRRRGRTNRRNGPKMDANNDGGVSLSEALSANDRIFERLDTNGDAVIDAGELDAMAARGEARRYWWRESE